MQYTQPNVYEFISKQTSDPIVERKTCVVSGTNFAIFQSDLEFYDKISPTFTGEKFQIPTPTLCPEERQRRRLARRNDRHYFRSTCDASGVSVITNYNPKDYKVYANKYRWSDAWNAEDYGREYDMSRSFFKQFSDLEKEIPHMALWNDNDQGSENSLYSYDTLKCKDCYMTHQCVGTRNGYYVIEASGSTDVAESMILYKSVNCIECNDSWNLTNCMRMNECKQCYDCAFCRNCDNCEECIGCYGLVNKQYCVFNKQFSKEEYEQYKQEFLQKIYTESETFMQQCRDFIDAGPRKAVNIKNVEHAQGNNLFDSQYMRGCFDMKESKNCTYFYLSAGAKNSMDISISCRGERSYESVTTDGSRKTCFSLFCGECRDVWYSQFCVSCKDCFGCHSLRNKQYCIFNKQYTKEEYEDLVEKIINAMQTAGERGEFFPISHSSFGYNLSNAQHWMSLKEDKTKELGYTWDATEIRVNIPEHGNVIKAGDLSINPHNHDAGLADKIIVCEISGRPFRILAPELVLYQRVGAPLSRIHPDERHKQRMQRRAPRELHLRSCDKTGEEIISVYSQENSFEVRSEEAYNQEMYS